MVEFISFLVTNMRAYWHESWEDPSIVGWRGISDPNNWRMGYGNEAQTEWLQLKRKRGTLAFNLAILDYVQAGMGNNFYCDDVYLGKDGAYLGEGSGIGLSVCHIVSGILPLQDKDLLSAWRKLYPSENVSGLFGSRLLRKVWLTAPLFHLVPPENCENEVDLTSLLSLEDIDEDEIRESGLGEILNLASRNSHRRILY